MTKSESESDSGFEVTEELKADSRNLFLEKETKL